MTNENKIFPILAYEEGNTKFVDNGTGFHINKEGFIISAGHVINNCNWKYYAWINGKLYIIDKVHKEYLDQVEQIPPYYKDLFIGKIDFKADPDNIVKFSICITKNDYCLACGYSLRNLTPSIGESFSKNDFWGDSLKGENKNSLQNHPKYFELKYQCFNLFTFRVVDGDRRFFKNGLSIDMKGQKPVGLSGGPIIKDGTVRGIVIAKNNCISSQYITSKLDELGIKYY